MSLNISSDNTNATSMQSLARSNIGAGSRVSKLPVSDHMPNAAGAAPKPGSPGEQPDRPPLRTHPAASTDDPLQRLPETGESGRQRFRAKKGTTGARPEVPDAQAAIPLQETRCPYDPPPTRQRDLDMLA
jgi:hypothetical protein